MLYSVVSSGEHGLLMKRTVGTRSLMLLDSSETRIYMQPTPNIITSGKWGTFYTHVPDADSQATQAQLDKYAFSLRSYSSLYCNDNVFMLSQVSIDDLPMRVIHWVDYDRTTDAYVTPIKEGHLKRKHGAPNRIQKKLF